MEEKFEQKNHKVRRKEEIGCFLLKKHINQSRSAWTVYKQTLSEKLCVNIYTQTVNFLGTFDPDEYMYICIYCDFQMQARVSLNSLASRDLTKQFAFT